MGKGWKVAGKQANDQRRSKEVGKLVKEIIVSAKMGGPDPAGNSRLRAALEAARKVSVPGDTIKRALKKSEEKDKNVMETVTFEGFAPHQVPVIVECLTDNKNRTSTSIRMLFRKGQLGESGSVMWMFDRLGVVEAMIAQEGIDIEEAAIEAGAQDVEALGTDEVEAGQTGARFLTSPTDLGSVTKALIALGWVPSTSELNYVGKNDLSFDGAKQDEVLAFLEALDDDEDVHRIYTAYAAQ